MTDVKRHVLTDERCEKGAPVAGSRCGILHDGNCWRCRDCGQFISDTEYEEVPLNIRDACSGPAEPASPESTRDTIHEFVGGPYLGSACETCGVSRNYHDAIQAKLKPAPPDDPDLDEVRRAYARAADLYHWYGAISGPSAPVVLAAARAYHRLREQQRPSDEAPHHPECTRSFDARDWARDFCRIADGLGHKGIDEGWMISWFANALMRGWDEHASRYPEQQSPSIAQVVEACGAPARTHHRVSITQDSTTRKWCAFLEVRNDDFSSPWRPWKFGADGHCMSDTPEAALRALYDDAVARLREQAKDAADKLTRLGVEP